MPMPRIRGGRLVMSRPSISIRPSDGCSRPASIRQAVVFPEPDGPSRTTNSPRSNFRLRPSRAVVPSAKRLVTSVKETAIKMLRTSYRGGRVHLSTAPPCPSCSNIPAIPGQWPEGARHSGSAFHRSKCEAAHQMPLHEEGEDEDRQRGDDSHRGHLSPQGSVRSDQARNADRQRPPLEGHENEGIEKLVPGEDEAQDSSCGHARRRHRNDDADEGA